jgi:hypothetical protein
MNWLLFPLNVVMTRVFYFFNQLLSSRARSAVFSFPRTIHSMCAYILRQFRMHNKLLTYCPTNRKRSKQGSNAFIVGQTRSFQLYNIKVSITIIIIILITINVCLTCSNSWLQLLRVYGTYTFVVRTDTNRYILLYTIRRNGRKLLHPRRIFKINTAARRTYCIYLCIHFV